MSILIKNVRLNGHISDIYIKENRIDRIEENMDIQVDVRIDGTGKAAIPTFVNGHTHNAMTLFRGFAEDMALEEWLHEKIWPQEAKLTEEDVYWGARLGCLEMIKSGTTLFNDMYWYFHATARAVEEMGMRGVLSAVMIDNFDASKTANIKTKIQKLYAESLQYSGRIKFAMGPHAIYTVSADALVWAKQFADAHHLLYHIHLSETETEVENSLKQFGLRPVQYLEQLGVLGENVVIAHGVWLSDEDIEVLAKRKVKVVHNPNSNLKLASGYKFRYQELRDAGVCVGLGTDGCSSSNNLDMLEAMKVASLLQKAWRYDPTALPVDEVMKMGTVNGGNIFGIKLGRIEEGYLADINLINLSDPALVPRHNLNANLVYAAGGSCVDTVICDGKVIMENRHVPGEEEIIRNAQEVAMHWIKR
ncbi:MAG: amidohydrolase [Bacteroidales bacterium]|nr:amidohydrolase [Bacteroidales bacterium]MDD2323416.1 amidohydrolase [Bacteroidales bacterium]MDD3010881.1 amidohydrolase [Bacteroidales bacterium]MDD3962302.1 amidohydrolase [Bacteroidales bacterium]MDY0286174.1 amidohydrolase [Bacteroidales bacterium]